jgi:hypothetical protein
MSSLLGVCGVWLCAFCASASHWPVHRCVCSVGDTPLKIFSCMSFAGVREPWQLSVLHSLVVGCFPMGNVASARRGVTRNERDRCDAEAEAEAKAGDLIDFMLRKRSFHLIVE